MSSVYAVRGSIGLVYFMIIPPSFHAVFIVVVCEFPSFVTLAFLLFFLLISVRFTLNVRIFPNVIICVCASVSFCA
eukprot:CCRYP_011058-RE/>CCRYP_011058-RE protein AED:0.40 eAED:0.40 QI:300/1/1/1/0/0/2/0/75